MNTRWASRLFLAGLMLFHSVTSLPLPKEDTRIGMGAIYMNKTSVRTSTGNSSCIIVGCDSRKLPSSEHFWNFYSKSGYVTTFIQFDSLFHKETRGAPHWCRVPAVIRELNRVPNARVLYADIDTRVDFREWCDMEGLGENAPIIMNSVFRRTPFVQRDYTAYGSQVQSNAFVVEPGNTGINAMKRWEDSYYFGDYQDQGAIHLREHKLCGIPGWIHCYSNPGQQGCHCTGSSHGMDKDICLRKLFEGKLPVCDLK